MKQFFWNLTKLAWVIAAAVGYILYFQGQLSAVQTMGLEAGLSLLLTGAYSFLSGYRLPPKKKGDKEFNPATDVGRFNPNQWLVVAWVLQSVAIVIPGYGQSLAWAIAAPIFLCIGMIIVAAVMTTIGREYRRG